MQNPNIPEDWKQTIRGYVPKDEREAAEKAEILTLIDREGERLLTRDCAYAHVTASSVIVNRARRKNAVAVPTRSYELGMDGRPRGRRNRPAARRDARGAGGDGHRAAQADRKRRGFAGDSAGLGRT